MTKFTTLLIVSFSFFITAGGNAFAASADQQDYSQQQSFKDKHHAKPKAKETTYAWEIGAWGKCSAVKCGTQGKQKRSVECLKNGQSQVSDKRCESPKPATSQVCSAPACSPVSTTTTSTMPKPTTTTITVPRTTTTTLPVVTTTTLKPTTTTTTLKPTTTTTTLKPTTTTTTMAAPVTTTTMAAPVTTTTMPSTGAGSGIFPSASIWYQDISAAAKDAQSDTIINWLNGKGWGSGAMKVDLGLNIQYAISTTPFVTFKKSPDYYTGECDNLTTFPIPVGGAVENNPGYQCADNSDCHLLVVDPVNQKLWESYQTDVTGNVLQSTCAIAWDMKKVYPANLRGDGCTSVDAAGFPVAPLLFTADELKAGVINHAIRFILPNADIAKGIYVHPATHVGGPSGPVATAVPYGAHFRLKASTDISKLKPAAQVVARAMMKYGMFLADGGNIALTAADDTFTTAKYSQVGFTTQDLTSLKVSDFEMVDGGTRYNADVDCKLNP